MKIRVLTVLAAGAFAIGCGGSNPVTSPSNDAAPAPPVSAASSPLAEALAERPPAGMVKVISVRDSAGARVVSQKNITREQALAMNAHRASRQAARARGEALPQVASHGNEIGRCWDDDTLWLNDETDQTFDLIECPDKEDKFVFQVKSYWSGNFGFQFWQIWWDTGCFGQQVTNRHVGRAWERVDNFAAPYPSYATVNN
jgi:hypothetical protein